MIANLAATCSRPWKKAAIARGLMCVSSRLFALLVEAQHAVLEDIQTLAQLLRLDRLVHRGRRRGVGRGRRIGRVPSRITLLTLDGPLSLFSQHHDIDTPVDRIERILPIK